MLNTKGQKHKCGYIFKGLTNEKIQHTILHSLLFFTALTRHKWKLWRGPFYILMVLFLSQEIVLNYTIQTASIITGKCKSVTAGVSWIFKQNPYLVLFPQLDIFNAELEICCFCVINENMILDVSIFKLAALTRLLQHLCACTHLDRT